MTAAPTAEPRHLAVRETGRGPAVCWLHGYTMDSRVWDLVWPRLPGFRHVGVDLPGHGTSPALPADAPLGRWAELVEEVMAERGCRLLVAMCLGTMVAAEIAIRARIRLGALVLAAPALVGMPQDAATARRFASVAIRAMRGATQEDLVRLWLQEPAAIFAGVARHPDRYAVLRDAVAAHRWPTIRDGGPAAFRVGGQALADLAHGSAARTLVISGTEDLAEQRATARAMAEQLPGCTLAEYRGLGHLPPLEDPAVVGPVIADFLGAAADPDRPAG